MNRCEKRVEIGAQVAGKGGMGPLNRDFRAGTQAEAVKAKLPRRIPASTVQEVAYPEAVLTRSSAVSVRNPTTQMKSVGNWTLPRGQTTNSNPLKREATMNLYKRKVEIEAQLLHLEVAKGGMGPHHRDTPTVTPAEAVKVAPLLDPTCLNPYPLHQREKSCHQRKSAERNGNKRPR